MAPEAPDRLLRAGVELLDAVVRPHGFEFVGMESGKGSGGAFSSGEYVRGTRRLGLWVRYEAANARYDFGDLRITHEELMAEVLGGGSGRFPGFSSDPIQTFLALRDDLRDHGAVFLAAPDEQLRAVMLSAKSRPVPTGFAALSRRP